MGYGDWKPLGNYAKKPLTRKQLQKRQEAYQKGDMIATHVQALEKKEEKKVKEEIEDELKKAFL